MAVTIQCPNPDCQANYTVDESIVSRNVKCRRCNSVFAAQPTLDRSVGDTRPSPTTAQNPFPDLPAEFGRYRLLSLLGRGGMGCVYHAHDTQLGRSVALKIPSMGSQDDARRAARFVREARASAILQHPNICTVYDAGQIGNQPFIAMEFIEGRSLGTVVGDKEPLADAMLVDLFRKLADALNHAHNKGIVHRDLKPANVMLTADGQPKLMDFGLAKQIGEASQLDTKLTHEGAVMGTPSYMSPEQARGDQSSIGPATDVYSLGVMLYEALTGQLPYSGTLGLVMGQILAGPVPMATQVRPNANKQLAAICKKAMAKEIKDRYSSMAEFVNALSSIHLAAPARWQGGANRYVPYHLSSSLRARISSPLTIALSATLAVCLLGALLWYMLLPSNDTNMVAKGPSISRSTTDSESHSSIGAGTEEVASTAAVNALPTNSNTTNSSPSPSVTGSTNSAVGPGVSFSAQPVGNWLFTDLAKQGLAAATAFQLQNDQSVLLRGEGRNFVFVTQDQHESFKFVLEFRFPTFPLEGSPRVVIGLDSPAPQPSEVQSLGNSGFEISLIENAAGTVLLPNEGYPVELPFGQARDGRRVSPLRPVALTTSTWNQLEVECDGRRNVTIKINGAVVSVLSNVSSTKGHIALWPQNTNVEIRNPSLQSSTYSGALGFVLSNATANKVSPPASNANRSAARSPYATHAPGMIWSTQLGGSDSRWTCGRISPRGNQAAAFEYFRFRGVSKLHIWPLYDGQTGKDSTIFDFKEELSDTATAMVYSSNGKQIAFSTLAGTIFLLDLDRHAVDAKLKRFKSPVTGLALSNDGKLMAAAGREAGIPIVLWELGNSGAPSVRANITVPHDDEIASLAFSPDSKTLYAGGKNKLYACSLSSPENLAPVWTAPPKSVTPLTKDARSWLRSIAVSPDGKEIAIAEGRRVFLVELGKSTLTRYTLLDEEDGLPMIGVDYSADGSRIVSSGYNQRILVWSSTDGRLIWKSPVPTPSSEGVSISPDGSLVLTAGHDRQAMDPLNVTQLWKLPTE